MAREFGADQSWLIGHIPLVFGGLQQHFSAPKNRHRFSVCPLLEIWSPDFTIRYPTSPRTD
jgi:hypothetical protein